MTPRETASVFAKRIRRSLLLAIAALVLGSLVAPTEGMLYSSFSVDMLNSSAKRGSGAHFRFSHQGFRQEIHRKEVPFIVDACYRAFQDTSSCTVAFVRGLSVYKLAQSRSVTPTTHYTHHSDHTLHEPMCTVCICLS